MENDKSLFIATVQIPCGGVLLSKNFILMIIMNTVMQLDACSTYFEQTLGCIGQRCSEHER